MIRKRSTVTILCWDLGDFECVILPVPVLCMKIATALSILGNDVQKKRLHDFNTAFSNATHVPVSLMRVLGNSYDNDV